MMFQAFPSIEIRQWHRYEKEDVAAMLLMHLFWNTISIIILIQLSNVVGQYLNR